MIKRIYKILVPEKSRNKIRQNLNKIIALIYYGNNYTCNCCNKSFRKFFPKGNIKRENVRCPNCGSLERTRVLQHYLVNETDLFFRKQSVLHFAPESCLFNQLKNLDIEYVDGDINPANATHVIDITNIQYPDDYFDLVICSHVLGHVPNEARAIHEIKRVMKKDGIALIMTLIDRNRQKTFEDQQVVTEEERLLNYGERDLCRLHGRDFEERLQEQGLEVTCIDYAQQLPRSVAEANRLGDGSRELIFKCQKIE